MFKTALKVDLSDIEQLTKKFPEASRTAREEALEWCMKLLEREIVERTPRGAGPIHLADATFTDVGVRGAKVWGVVGNPLEHGVPVELGTKPHFPPIGPIQHWVERILHKGGKEAKSIAFCIARRIAGKSPKGKKGGTKGAHMFEKGFEASEDRLKHKLEEIPADIIRRVS